MSISVPTTDWVDWFRPTVLELNTAYPLFSWGTYPGHDPSIHNAADGMVPAWQTAAGRAKGQALADHIARTSFMKPRGGWYVIFWGRIWSMTRPSSGWLPYFDRNNTNPSRSHHNHVHFSAYLKKPAGVVLPVPPVPAYPPSGPPPVLKPYTEGWVPATPWTFYLDRQEIGTTQSDSAWLIQKALGLKPYDGNYTAELRAAVKDWQLNTLKDDPKFCDGVLGLLQARSLFNDTITIETSSK